MSNFNKLVDAALNEYYHLAPGFSVPSKQTLTLIRGLPGSGKTTYALSKILKQDPNTKHFEADTHFETIDDVTGERKYNFNPKELPVAHNKCFENTKKALQSGSNVVVTNTFTQIWEMQNYINMVTTLNKTGKFHIQLKVFKATGNFKNTHGVPPESIDKMRNRWEDYDSEEELVN